MRANARGLLWAALCGLLLLSRTAAAKVVISGIVVDGQPRPVPVPAGETAHNSKPLRLSAATQSLRFQLTAGDTDEQPAVRLRYKLEGYDDAWRELSTRMRLLVLFSAKGGGLVGSHEFSV